jgi:hypothetical protein
MRPLLRLTTLIPGEDAHRTPGWPALVTPKPTVSKTRKMIRLLSRRRPRQNKKMPRPSTKPVKLGTSEALYYKVGIASVRSRVVSANAATAGNSNP